MIRIAAPPIFDPEAAAPHSPEAEMQVIGGMMFDQDAREAVLEMLGVSGSNAFLYESHRRFYRALVRLHERGDAIDETTLSEELKAMAAWEDGDWRIMASLMDCSLAAHNIEYHCRIVQNDALRRRLLESLNKARGIAADRTLDAREALAEAERLVMEVDALAAAREEMIAVDEVLDAYLESLEHEEPGIPTGWSEFDFRVSGLQRGKLYLVAARPSMGKSAWAEQLALHVAIDGHLEVDFYATEMGRDEFLDRGIQMRGRVDMVTFRQQIRNAPDMAEHGRFAAGLADIQKARGRLRLATDVRTVAEISARSTRNQRRKGLRLIVVDHLIDMLGPGKTQEEVIATIARELKQLARKLDVPVVATTQLSRKVEAEERRRDGYRPRMSDLRQAGEEPADFVGLLYRPEYYFGSTMQTKSKDGGTEEVNVEGRAEMIVGKQRNGWRGTLHYYFHKELTRFDTLETQRQ